MMKIVGGMNVAARRLAKGVVSSANPGIYSKTYTEGSDPFDLEDLLARGLIMYPSDDIGDMDGPCDYTKDEVDKRVKNTALNGNYRTGHLNAEGDFILKL